MSSNDGSWDMTKKSCKVLLSMELRRRKKKFMVVLLLYLKLHKLWPMCVISA